MSLLIRSILERRDFVRSLTSLLTEEDLHKQLATILFLSSNVKCQSISENINDICSRYPKIYKIVTENSLMLPEEETEVDRVVRCMHEEMITSSAVDSSTPRIVRNGSVKNGSIFKR